MTRGWRYWFCLLVGTSLFCEPSSLSASDRIDVIRSEESQGVVDVNGAYGHEKIELECFAHRADCQMLKPGKYRLIGHPKIAPYQDCPNAAVYSGPKGEGRFLGVYCVLSESSRLQVPGLIVDYPWIPAATVDLDVVKAVELPTISIEPVVPLEKLPTTRADR